MKYERSPILIQDPSPEHLEAYERLKKAFASAVGESARVWEGWTRINNEQDLEYTRLQQEKWEEIGRRLEEEENEETDNS